MTFEERCSIAQRCLPEAPYRDMLTKLHHEMLAAIAAERERCARVCEELEQPTSEREAAALDCAAAIRG